MLANRLAFRWLGVAGIELSINGSLLAIDPFFTRPPLHSLFFGRITPNPYQMAGVDLNYEAILVTHAHYDHFMDVPTIAQHSGAQVYGSPNVCQLAILCGLPPEQVHELQPGTTCQLASAEITILPASHLPVPNFQTGKIASGLKPPLRLRDYRMDQCFSYLIDTGSTRILDWCGTNTEPLVEADILFTGWGSEVFLTRLLKVTQPKVLVPIHWDQFFHPLNKPIKPLPFPPAWLFPAWARNNPLQIAHRMHHVNPSLQVLIPERFKQVDVARLLDQS